MRRSPKRVSNRLDMRPSFIVTPARPLDELALCQWIGRAAPGDILEYHRGFLAIDTASLARGPAELKTLRLLARRAAWAAEERFVHLVQRRIGPGVFAYLVIKRPRGFTSLPAIDTDGGQLLDLRTVSARGVVSA